MKDNILTNTLSTFLCIIIVFVTGFMVTPLIINFSGEEVFGLYSLVVCYLTFVSGIASFGTGTFFKRKILSIENEEEKTYLFYEQFWFHFSSLTVLSCIAIFLFKNILGFNKGDIELNFLYFIYYIISFGLYNNLTNYLRFSLKIKTLNLINILQPIVFVIVLFFIYYNRNNITIDNLLISASSVYTILVLFILLIIYKNYGFKFCFYNLESLSKELKIGFPLCLSFIVDSLIISGDRYVIAYMTSISKVAHYVPAYQLGMLPLILPKAICTVLLPIIFKSIDNNKLDFAKKLQNHSYNIILIVAIPFIFLSHVYGEYLLLNYTNKSIANFGKDLLPIISSACLFFALYMINSNIIMTRLKTKLLLYVNLFSCLINLSLNFLFLHYTSDLKFVALSTLISYFICFYFTYYNLKNDELKPNFDMKIIIYLLLASTLIFSCSNYLVNLVTHESLLSFVFEIIILLILYILILFCNKSIRVMFYDIYNLK